MNPLKYSKKIREIADQLLQESKIIDTLKDYGQVALTGSYKYDLMYKPDIDMYIYNDNLDRDLFSKITKDIVVSDFFDFFYLEDTYSDRRENIPGVPRGYYIRIDHKFKDYLFKFDIMVVKNREQKESHYTDETKAIIEQLESESFTQSERESIIKLKHYKYQNKATLPPIRSFDIYKSVLKLKITEPDEFIAWLKQQPEERY